jgi:hypothetical protein
MAVIVHGIDNRGTAEVPFGYVYVAETRVGFHTTDEGVQVWATRPSGYWPPPTHAEFRAAVRALVGAGIADGGAKVGG